MRPPGYLTQVAVERQPRALLVGYRLRAWHPSILPLLWRMLDVRPRALKPAFVALAWLHLMRRGSCAAGKE